MFSLPAVLAGGLGRAGGDSSANRQLAQAISLGIPTRMIATTIANGWHNS